MILTERLELVPLKYDMLSLLLHDMAGFNKEMNWTYLGEPPEGFFADIVEKQLEKIYADSKNYIWHTFWMIVRKNDRVVIGSIDFKDIPDSAGKTEIGYGLSPEFEQKGYMTEAAEAFCSWGFANGCRNITAETEIANLKSQSVLLRCGFKEISRDKTVWWSLSSES